MVVNSCVNQLRWGRRHSVGRRVGGQLRHAHVHHPCAAGVQRVVHGVVVAVFIIVTVIKRVV